MRAVFDHPALAQFGAFLRFLGAAAAVACAVVVATLYSFNHFNDVEGELAPNCTPVIGVPGPEDLQIDRRRRRAFVSSFDRAGSEAADGHAIASGRGGIFVINIDDPLDAGNWRERTGGAPAQFEPLGLSYFDDGERRRLFVVNAATNSVELYDVADDGDLVHLETFAELRLTSPNSVAATGPRSFYVSNDVDAGRGGLMGKLAFLGRAGAGKVYFFNGVSFRLAAEGLRFANGLALSGDGETLYVAESAGMSLKTFVRDPETGVLDLRDTRALPGAADNINVLEDGSLLVAANPKPLTVDFHRRRASPRSPSLILRIERPNSDPNADAAFPTGVDGSLEPVYATDGAAYSAASVADMAGNTLMIGGLAEDRFLICDAASR